METIKSKRVLHSKIREILGNNPEDDIKFPQLLSYREGMGEPIFKITVEKIEEDYYIDESGQKLVKA